MSVVNPKFKGGSRVKEGGPYSPDPRNTDATWSIFYTKVHLCHRSKKKKKFLVSPKKSVKKVEKVKKTLIFRPIFEGVPIFVG